mmetsp:Transcript_10706/g.31719  ORF Transcript_10706/g.31719 Transcript_10706/m.31719 type:complete len:274 (+) Transcript_10706:1006-1827(+)
MPPGVLRGPPHQPRHRPGRALLRLEGPPQVLCLECDDDAFHDRLVVCGRGNDPTDPAHREELGPRGHLGLPDRHGRFCRNHKLDADEVVRVANLFGEPQDEVRARDAHALQGHGAQIHLLVLRAVLHRVLQAPLQPPVLPDRVPRAGHGMLEGRLLLGSAVAARHLRDVPLGGEQRGPVLLPQGQALVAQHAPGHPPRRAEPRPEHELLAAHDAGRPRLAGPRGHVGRGAAVEEGLVRRVRQRGRGPDFPRLRDLFCRHVAVGVRCLLVLRLN